MTPLTLLALGLSYLLGAVPAAAWVARSRGVDIRKVGSGNSGATNVMRALGKGPALFVAAFDILKGALAVLLARLLGLGDDWAGLCGLLAVIGHNFSPFLGFHGGKGVATTFGVLAILAPVSSLLAFAIAIFTMWMTRFVSAGSIVGALIASALVGVQEMPLWLRGLVWALSALLIWQHRDNITKLRAGTERRFGEKV